MVGAKKCSENVYSIEEVVNHYGIGRFTLRLMILLGLLCTGIGSISSAFTSTLSLSWQCYYNDMMDPKLTLCIVNGGLAFGSICYGWLADRCGRKPLIIFTTAISWYFSCLLVMTNDGVFFILNIFIISTGFYGKHIMTNYSAEAFPKTYRPKLQTYLGICVACGASIAPLIAYFGNINSNQLILIISLPLTVCIFLPMFFPESIAYLQITANMKGLLLVFKHLSTCHKKRPPKRCNLSTKYVTTRGNLFWLFKGDTVLKTLMMTSLWCTATLASTASIVLQGDLLSEPSLRFQCLGYPKIKNIPVCSLEDLRFEEYQTSTYGAIADLCGMLLCLLTIDIFTRYQWFIFALISTGLGFGLMNICSSYLIHRFIMLVTRGLSAGFLQIIYVFTNEVYTTSIRCSATGFYSFVSSLFVMVIPLLLDKWTNLSPVALSNIYVFMCTLTCLMVPFLMKRHARDVEDS